MVMSRLDLMWHLPPKQLSVSRDEVHIWRAFLDLPTTQVEQLKQTLSPDELVRAERFYFERDKHRFIVARALLRTTLGSYLGVQPWELQFGYGHRGKPDLAAIYAESRLRFNVSHSQNLVVYAVSCERELGVDVEFIRPINEAEQIAKRYFSVRENTSFQSLAPSEKQVGFFYHWTRKEAYLKAEGEGLSADNDLFDASVATEDTNMPSSSDLPGDRWFLQGFTPAPNYVATVAVKGKGWDLAYWQCPQGKGKG